MKNVEKIKELADFLTKTGEKHHQAFIETNGEDAEWPKWYSEYMLKDDYIKEIICFKEIDSLSSVLKELGDEYGAGKGWQEKYSEKLLDC